MDDAASMGMDDRERASARCVRLRIPARPEHVALARLALVGLAPLAGLGEEALADLKRAVTEAVSGALAQRRNAGGAVEIHYELTADELRIEVAGDGVEPAGAALGAVAARTIVLERDRASQAGGGAGRDRFTTHPGLDA